MNSKDNIILIGMSGAGKSTLGVLLAKAMGMNFVDTDIEIQRRENRLLQEIIETDGSESFIKTEEEVVCSLRYEHHVIATGGSVIYSDRTMKYLGKMGKIVYLYVRLAELERRLHNVATRGIVFRNGGSLREIYEERLPLYEKYSDITVDCTELSMNQAVRMLISGIQNI